MFLIKIVYTSVINWECFLKGTLCVWVLCLYVHLRVIYKPNAKGGQKEYQICWNWSVRGWWTAVWLPGIEPEFSRKAASAFSHWTISPAPNTTILKITLRPQLFCMFLRLSACVCRCAHMCVHSCLHLCVEGGRIQQDRLSMLVFFFTSFFSKYVWGTVSLLEAPLFDQGSWPVNPNGSPISTFQVLGLQYHSCYFYFIFYMVLEAWTGVLVLA